LLTLNEIPKEDLDYILEPFKEEDNKEEDNKQITSDKIIAIVMDAKGNIIDKREQKMKSLTQYYLALISIPILQFNYFSSSKIVQSILGLPSTVSVGSNCFAILNFDTSIQLGSGTQSFTPTLNSLSALISNGTGTGQLYYNNQSVSYTNNSIIQLLKVSNSSGNTITVSEIGLMGTIYLSSCSSIQTTKNFLLSYDTFSSPISIPNSASALFQITITFSG
jgi:hypothetical protein